MTEGTAGGLPPAGWHPDPYGKAAQRWWDGTQWTADTLSAPPPPAPPAPQADPPTTPQPRQGDSYKLKAGRQIELAVNLGDVSEAVEAKLLGRKRDEYVERTVKVVMFRDEDSPYPTSVRVELPTGEFLGSSDFSGVMG